MVFTRREGVSDRDMVEAVQLMGQFREPAAMRALLSVLRDAARRVEPYPLGRWLRDTALDTLLRSPAQPRPQVERALARYYSLQRRLPARRLERNIIYDDIPVLARHGLLGLLLRVYVLPLVGLLFALVVLAELVAGRSGPLAGNDLAIFVAGSIFFIALGLGVFNLHQIVLVLLASWLGPRLTLPGFGSWAFKSILAGVLALGGLSLSVYVALSLLRQAVGARADYLLVVTVFLLALPLLVVPCYMLAHDIETGYRQGGLAAPGRGALLWAMALRWTSGVLYVVYIMVAYGVVFFAGLFPELGYLASWPGRLFFFAYLLAAPVLVLLLLSAPSRVRRNVRTLER
jgi:hypothetical protein